MTAAHSTASTTGRPPRFTGEPHGAKSVQKVAPGRTLQELQNLAPPQPKLCPRTVHDMHDSRSTRQLILSLAFQPAKRSVQLSGECGALSQARQSHRANERSSTPVSQPSCAARASSTAACALQSLQRRSFANGSSPTATGAGGAIARHAKQIRGVSVFVSAMPFIAIRLIATSIVYCHTEQKNLRDNKSLKIRSLAGAGRPGSAARR